MLSAGKGWDRDGADVDVVPLRLMVVLRPKRRSMRSKTDHFFASSFHTFLLHTKMTKMKRPVKMLMTSVGIQMYSLAMPPTTKEMISIIHDTPIKMKMLNMTRNLNTNTNIITNLVCKCLKLKLYAGIRRNIALKILRFNHLQFEIINFKHVRSIQIIHIVIYKKHSI